MSDYPEPVQVVETIIDDARKIIYPCVTAAQRIVKRFILIERDELPEGYDNGTGGQEFSIGNMAEGERSAAVSEVGNTPDFHRRMALNHLAMSAHLTEKRLAQAQEKEKAEEKAEAKVVEARRSQLASELITGGTIPCTGAPGPDTPIGKAINMIMALEDRLTS